MKDESQGFLGAQPLFFVFFVCLASCIVCPLAFAEEEAASAEDRAKEIHRLASSDVIYQDQETKAIYYQNVQIIDLLRQIRDLLDSRLTEKQE